MVERHLALQKVSYEGIESGRCCCYAHPCIDLDMACRLCGMREEDVAAARASGLNVREREAIAVVYGAWELGGCGGYKNVERCGRRKWSGGGGCSADA